MLSYYLEATKKNKSLLHTLSYKRKKKIKEEARLNEMRYKKYLSKSAYMRK